MNAAGTELVVPAALHRDAHRRALRPAQLLDRIVAGPALGVFAFNLRNDVAAPQPLLVGGRALEEGHDGNLAVDDRDRDAEAVITTFLAFAHLGIRARVHEAGVRIQRLEHSGDGAVDEPIGLHRADVAGVDGRQSGRKDLILVWNLVFNRERAPAVEAADKGAEDDGKHSCR